METAPGGQCFVCGSDWCNTQTCVAETVRHFYSKERHVVLHLRSRVFATLQVVLKNWSRSDVQYAHATLFLWSDLQIPPRPDMPQDYITLRCVSDGQFCKTCIKWNSSLKINVITEQNWTKLNRTKQNWTELNRTEQNWTQLDRTE
jgi:hypothetical protein